MTQPDRHGADLIIRLSMAELHPLGCAALENRRPGT
jgi:hypothetical protein